jgi:hypothetical protein
MHSPDVYELPRVKHGNPIPWLTALSIAAMVIGATLALVIVN